MLTCVIWLAPFAKPFQRADKKTPRMGKEVASALRGRHVSEKDRLKLAGTEAPSFHFPCFPASPRALREVVYHPGAALVLFFPVTQAVRLSEGCEEKASHLPCP